jgi:endonuclease/exonuclease/phosphatase family metal-dependent hydrolase
MDEKFLNIMTYNICWEALEAKKGGIDMTKCNDKKQNKCMKNIADIINKRIDNNFNFISLQEINSNQWINLSKLLKLDNYNIIKKEIGLAGIFILYNNNYKLIKKYSGDLGCCVDKRPYIISIFDNNVVLINLHLPHVNQENSLIKLQQKLVKGKKYYNKDTIFIICGDFNNDNPRKIIAFNDILKNINRKLKDEPRLIKTCCIPNDKKYKYSYDHIYISSNSKYIKYNTIRENEKNKYMSDHLPIFAKIKH